MLTLLLALGCSERAPADAYTAALAASDFDAAWALCAEAGPNRPDCEQAVSARFSRFERCERIEAGVWRDECAFAAAEHLSRQKDRPGALAACQATRFAVNCEQHVLDSLAMDLRETPAPEVADALRALDAGIHGKNSRFDFWRSWHRVRYAARLPIVAEDCPDKVCRQAAQVQVAREVRDGVARNGCGAEPPIFPGATPRVARWVGETWRDRCCAAPDRAEIPACGSARVEPARETE